jgi:beta-lactamase superfamily II metal-dependent hydrolase
MFMLEALDARHGDSLLLRWGSGAVSRLIVIDGGPSGVFRASLQPRLDELRAERGGADPLTIDLLMVSHIDDDHIRGVLDLTRHLLELKKERRSLPWKVASLWHNSFDDLLGNAAPLTASLEPAVRPVSTGGPLPPELPLDRPAALVVASVGQGRELRNDAKGLNLRVNRPWGKLVWAPADGQRTHELAEGLRLTVLGPLEEQVQALQTAWDKKLEEMRRKSAAEAQAVAAEFVDRSVYNLSSIVVLASRGDHRMLLTGDARGDIVLQGLEGAGLLKDGAIHVDLFKLPHHGSSRNVTTEFFRRITADHYVVSADGRDGNPDPEMLAMLTEARGNADYRVYLTNREPRAEQFFAQDRQRGRRYEVVYRSDSSRFVPVALES